VLLLVPVSPHRHLALSVSICTAGLLGSCSPQSLYSVLARALRTVLQPVQCSLGVAGHGAESLTLKGQVNP
jgi:hypothetical protein